MRYLRPAKDYPCGYAPRILRRYQPSESDPYETIFVGAKDGTVTILRRRPSSQSGPAGDFAHARLRSLSRKAVPAGVRAIWAVGQDWLLVGRNDGTVDAVQWRLALSETTEPEPLTFRLSGGSAPVSENGSAGRPVSWDESVRYATPIGNDQILVSYRQAGTLLLTLDCGEQGNTLTGEILERAFDSPVRLGGVGAELGGIRLAAKLGGSSALESSYLFVDQLAQLWRWDRGDGRLAAFLRGPWCPREPPPALINDISFIGPRAKPSGLILTTDTGVFGIDLRPPSWYSGQLPHPVRLSLPGAGSMGMAVTYVELPHRAFLWLACRDGTCHLFANEPLAADLNFFRWTCEFHRAGHSLGGAQVLVAHAWTDGEQIWLARACRDDRVRIDCDNLEIATGSPGRSRSAPGHGTPRPSSPNAGPLAGLDIEQVLAGRGRAGETPLQELERPLRIFTTQADQRPYESWPAYAMLSEVLELLAEDNDRRLFQFLSSPDSTMANTILRELSSETEPALARSDLTAAIDLWSLCLVGLVNRQPEPPEEWYLGILRFLRGLSLSREVPELRRAVDRGIRFAFKWGLYGEVNQIRRDLVTPLQVLRAKLGDGQVTAENAGAALDELSYSVLLFRRSQSLVTEDESCHELGTTARAVQRLETSRDGDMVPRPGTHESGGIIQRSTSAPRPRKRAPSPVRRGGQPEPRGAAVRQPFPLAALPQAHGRTDWQPG